jgi:hypothetical protein
VRVAPAEWVGVIDTVLVVTALPPAPRTVTAGCLAKATS